MARPETVYKRFTLKAWQGWSELYEPGLGSGVGYPDVQLMCPSSHRLLPLEYKVGTVRKGRIFPAEVRPSQIVWHYKFSRAGGVSAIIIGVKRPGSDNVWDSYAIDGKRLSDEDWELGFELNSCFKFGPDHLNEDLQRLIINAFGGTLK